MNGGGHMENEKFQELVIGKFDIIDKKFDLIYMIIALMIMNQG